MKIYISVDMEGMAGTLSWDQEKQDRGYVKKLMAQQVEWLIEGIKTSASNNMVEEILIADSHSSGDSLPYEFTALDRRLRLISGSPRPHYMMPMLDSTYDVVFLAGYHGGGGSYLGVMDHTYTSNFHRITINGIPMNESLLNAALAGYHGVPVGLVTGDEALHHQLTGEQGLPWAKFVTTKIGLSRFAAVNRPLELIQEETISAVREMLGKNLKQLPVYRLEAPINLTLELSNSAMADILAMVPGVRRLDGRTVEFIHEDYATVYNAIEPFASLVGLYK